jgi:hypothetical protein
MTIYIDSKELENLSRKSTKQQLNMGGESHNFEPKKKMSDLLLYDFQRYGKRL